jgi:15-cis-phytoene synthase
VDEDRWLASRFAPAPARKRLVALYALNYEIARTAEAVTQEGIGDIRLAWWSQAIDEIYAGRKPRAHPALAAYAEAVREASLPRAPLDALIAARGKDLEAAPFATWADMDAYIDATAGNVLRLAAEVSAAGAAAPAQLESFIRRAGLAWGYAGLSRALPFWTARGRTMLPQGGHSVAALIERGVHASEAVHALSRTMPAALFPAIGYLALAPGYLRTGAAAPLLVRQARLILASATGKL